MQPGVEAQAAQVKGALDTAGWAPRRPGTLWDPALEAAPGLLVRQGVFTKLRSCQGLARCSFRMF